MTEGVTVGLNSTFRPRQTSAREESDVSCQVILGASACPTIYRLELNAAIFVVIVSQRRGKRNDFPDVGFERASCLRSSARQVLTYTIFSLRVLGVVGEDERKATAAMLENDADCLRRWRQRCPELHELWPARRKMKRWTGVMLGRGASSGKVVGIDLSGQDLTGEVPAELSKLTALNYLNLNDNQLTGAVPSEIGNLTALNVMYLRGNQLTGAVPSEIGHLTALEVMGFHGNWLSGEIPAGIGLLTALRTLNLGSHQLSREILAKLGHLIALNFLNLQENQLTGVVPEELGQLTALTLLSLDANKLTSIPAEPGNLTALEYLYLGNNQLMSVPAQLGQLASLKLLSLSGNQLTNLPSELGQLASLEELNVHCNQLTSVPAELGHLTALKRLCVTNNLKLDSLPAALCQQLVALDSLDDRLQLDDTLRTLIIAVERFTEAAESGDDTAQVLLAQCYLQGRGVEPNAELAASWFGKAADQGNTVGHWKLGMCYAEGVGIVKSVRRAVKHFRASADAGHLGATERMKVLTSCATCGAEDTRMICGGCVSASYCDVQCQRTDWQRSHKAPCRARVLVRDEVMIPGGQGN